MSSMERRLDRLEKQHPPFMSSEIWCCATEGDAQAILDRLREKHAPPLLLFIAGKPDETGAVTWRREGSSVQALFRVIDGYCTSTDGTLIAEPAPEAAPNPLVSQLSDEELLEVIAGDGFTLVLYHDGRARLLEAKEVFVGCYKPDQIFHRSHGRTAPV